MTLNKLYNLMVARDDSVMDNHGQWRTDLPTFGGDDIYEVGCWSWDESRVIVGDCAGDLSIMDRDEYLEWCWLAERSAFTD